MSALQSITAAGAAPAKGPYSPAIRAGNLLFVSGQIAVRPDGTSMADADLATQTRQCLANLRAVIEAGGATLDRVVKVTVYLADPGWPVFNPIYGEFFGTHAPARAIVPVAVAGGDSWSRWMLSRCWTAELQNGRTPNSMTCSHIANTAHTTPPTTTVIAVAPKLPGA